VEMWRIYFKVDKNRDTLSAFRGRNHIKAENGRAGEGRKRYGRKGRSVDIIVPPGTQVIDVDSGDILLDLTDDGDRVLFLKGGRGGLGNWHFKSSTNQRPTYAQPGESGVTKSVRLELKLIADIGLVGYPSVGKSTLISVISNARPKIAGYEFTTLIPNLGVVDIDEFNSFTVADIPGIIEGASLGRGLGVEFLKHIERTDTLLILIDIINYRDMEYQYRTLLEELESYSNKLYSKKFAVALTKCDSTTLEETNIKIEQFLGSLGLEGNRGLERYGADSSYISYRGVGRGPNFILPISAVSGLNINPLKYRTKRFNKYG